MQIVSRKKSGTKGLSCGKTDVNRRVRERERVIVYVYIVPRYVISRSSLVTSFENCFISPAQRSEKHFLNENEKKKEEDTIYAAYDFTFRVILSRRSSSQAYSDTIAADAISIVSARYRNGAHDREYSTGLCRRGI